MAATTLQTLLNEQAELAKKIAEFNKAEEQQKRNRAEFKAMIQRRKEAPARFGAAMAAGREKDLLQTLQFAGYERGTTSADKSTTTWGNKAKPGVLVIIKNSEFSVMKDNVWVVKNQPVKYIGTFVNKK